MKKSLVLVFLFLTSVGSAADALWKDWILKNFMRQATGTTNLVTRTPAPEMGKKEAEKSSPARISEEFHRVSRAEVNLLWGGMPKGTNAWMAVQEQKDESLLELLRGAKIMTSDKTDISVGVGSAKFSPDDGSRRFWLWLRVETW